MWQKMHGFLQPKFRLLSAFKSPSFWFFWTFSLGFIFLAGVFAHDAARLFAAKEAIKEIKSWHSFVQTKEISDPLYLTGVKNALPAIGFLPEASRSLLHPLFIPGGRITQNTATLRLRELDRSVAAYARILNEKNLSQESRESAMRDISRRIPRLQDGRIPESINDMLAWMRNPLVGNVIQDSKDSLLNTPYQKPRIKDISSLIELITNKSPKYFLVFFANTNEIRPQAGFFGSFAIVGISQGTPHIWAVDDIYNVDFPAQDRGFAPGADILFSEGFAIDGAYRENQYARDRNWGLDGPTTLADAFSIFSQQWEIAYPERPLPQIEGVVVITPDAVAPLLRITGPLTVEGIEFDAENFVAQLQFQVQQQYWRLGRRENERKQILGILAERLATEINKSTGTAGYLSLIDIAIESLNNKNAFLWFRDANLQNKIEQFGWANAIPVNTAGVAFTDIFAVFDANARALKTDAVMDKRIERVARLIPENDGYIAEYSATLTYTHTSAVYSWYISEYRSLTRVLIPPGSRVISLHKENNGIRTQLPVRRQSLGSWDALIIPVEVKKSNKVTYQIVYQIPTILRPGDRVDFRWHAQPGRRLAEVERGVTPETVQRVRLVEYGLRMEWTPSSEGELVWESIGQSDRTMKLRISDKGTWAFDDR